MRMWVWVAKEPCFLLRGARPPSSDGEKGTGSVPSSRLNGVPPPHPPPQGGADSVRVLVCTQVGAVPILAAIVKMPMSEMEP